MYKKILKNIIDFIFALVAIIIFAIPMIIIGILIKFDSEGPAFFKQARVGLNGRVFYIYKFRTMINNADKKGNLFTADNDWRITKIGKVLRRTSLDEVPQVINMLKGDMSIIGPRPDVVEEIPEEDKKYYRIRNSVKPGMTGYAQVMGRSSLSLEKRKEYEIYYAQNISLILDLKIFFLTIKTVLLKNGVN